MVADLSLADAPCLPSGIETPDALAGELFAAHTKSRQEKMLVRDLGQRDIGYYLPLYEKVSQHTRRRRYLSEEPLFPGYVFFAGDAHTPAIVMGTGRVCQTIKVVNQLRLRNDLANLYAAWLVNPRMKLCSEIVTGKTVRITSGALEGVTGIVVSLKRDALLVIQVSGFGQAAIEIPLDLVEPA